MAHNIGAGSLLLVIATVSCAAACGEGSSSQLPTQFEFGGDRPVFLEVPSGYDHSEGAPLLVVLHGFGANAFTQLAYTGLDELVEEAGLLLLAPNGTANAAGSQFWNATEHCCDFDGSGVDDVAYLSGLIDEVGEAWNLRDVYLLGHSNGGYMSYRMACERADLIAGMVSLAGLAWDDAGCQPSRGLRVLQIHGTDDDTVPYLGREDEPGARRSAELWAGHNGCASISGASTVRLDLDTSVDGADTTVEAFDDCPDSLAVELWTIEGGAHIPSVTDSFRGEIWRFLSGR